MITLEPPSTRAAVGGFSIRKPSLRLAGLMEFLTRARKAAGLKGQVHVLLAGDATLRRLNREFRGKNKATDVLSFPSMQMDEIKPAAGKRAQPKYAGDLAISLDTAARQAERFGHPVSTEVKVLMLHGLLHLAGYDHETDAGEMAELEMSLRRELKLPSGLIQRAESRRAESKTSSKKSVKKRAATKNGRGQA